jgi:hypothetical protein
MYCVVHGVPLPRLGSFEFHVLEEGLARERAEKVAFAKLLTGLLGVAADIPKEGVQLLLESYAATVHQVTYNEKYRSVERQLFEKRARQQTEDERLLEKVAEMTVPGRFDNA